MEHLLPTTASNWITAITIIILGGFALFSVFGKGVKEKREETDKADDRLINLLKSTVDALETKVKDLEASQQTTILELTRIKTENEVMAKILQGRDAATLEFQKMTGESIKAVMQVVTDTNKNVEHLYGLLEEHFKSIKNEHDNTN